jgi:hypothetical protein
MNTLFRSIRTRFEGRLIAAISGLLILFPTPGHAIVCESSFDQLAEQLLAKRHQAPVFSGTASKGINSHIFMSAEGTWSLVVKFTDGNYCILSEGNSSELFPKNIS